MKLLALAIGLCVLSTTYGAYFEKCDIATYLLKNGVLKSNIPDWLCLILQTSNFESSYVNKKGPDGTSDYGLFAINNRYYCKDEKFKDNFCNVLCSDLVDDKIDDDFKCAKLLFKRHGFYAWPGWQKKCNGKPLPSIGDCFPVKG